MAQARARHEHGEAIAAEEDLAGRSRREREREREREVEEEWSSGDVEHVMGGCVGWERVRASAESTTHRLASSSNAARRIGACMRWDNGAQPA